MRPVVKSDRRDSTGIPIEINPYGDAKSDLCDELGTFCSFCEKYNSRAALAVEHILGRKTRDVVGNLKYIHHEYRWDNFLIGCVNCNGIKGAKDVNILNPYMPHQNNLIHYIEILRGGIVQIKAGVTGVELQQTQSFIDLVGLDRVPGHQEYSNKDDRWDNRLKADDIAQRQLLKYTQPQPATDLETIVDLARTTGYFSIWYSVFHAFDEVKEALIYGNTDSLGNLIVPFPGIHHNSFDVHNHYVTVPRP